MNKEKLKKIISIALVSAMLLGQANSVSAAPVSDIYNIKNNTLLIGEHMFELNKTRENVYNMDTFAKAIKTLEQNETIYYKISDHWVALNDIQTADELLDAIEEVNKHKDSIVKDIQVKKVNGIFILETPENYSQPEKGTMEGTTKIKRLNLDGIVGAEKWQIKVQNDALDIPVLDSKIQGAEDYISNKDIEISAGQHLLLLAVDNNGQVKGYVDLVVEEEAICGDGQSTIPDTEKPVITHTEVADGQREDQKVTISADVTDNVGVESVKLYWREGNSGNFTEVAMSNGGSGNKYSVAISSDSLDAGTTIEYYIEAKDAAENTESKGNANSPLDFTVAAVPDTTTPSAISISIPADGEEEVVVNTNIKVQFDESLDTSTKGTVSFESPSTTFEDGRNCTITFSTTTNSNDTVIIDPDSELIESTTYSSITISGFADESGNTMSNYNDADYNFTTADITAADTEKPIITHTEVANGQRADEAVTISAEVTDNVGVSNVKLYWREGNSGNFTEVEMSNGGSGNTYSADIAANSLNEGTKIEYYIEAKDAENNKESKGSANSPLDFTVVAAPDTTTPSAISISIPADGAKEVVVNTNIKVQFDESLDTSTKGTVSFERPNVIFEDGRNCIITFSTTTNSNDTVIIDPDSELIESTTYSSITINGFADELGNTMSNYNDEDYNFTTVDIIVPDTEKPVITHAEVADGQRADQKVRISADITDNVEVASVKLYWREGNSGNFTEVEMSNGGSGNTYSADIAADSLNEGTTIEYYIEAKDAEDNKESKGSANSPLDFKVVVLANESIAAVNSATADTMGTVITNNASVLGLDLTDYNKLSDKSPVHAALEGKRFTDEAAVKTAFDEAAAVQKLAETPSTAPNAEDIIVTNNYASDDTVIVSNVPDGVVVKVYDSAEDGTKLGEAVNSTGSVGNVSVTISQIGTASGSVYVTITESRQAESIRVQKVYDSEETTAVDAVNAATEDTIKTVITNNAGVLGLNLTDYNKLSDNSPVHTALVNKSFGNAETVKAAFDNAVAAQKQVEAEAAAVAAVNSASSDTMGTVITNNAGVLGLDLTDYSNLKDNSPVHTALEGKSFADEAAVKATFDAAVAVQKLAETPSTAPNAGDITVTNNYESDDTVVISNVPDGTEVKVYDSEVDGNELGSAVNTTGSAGNVTVTIEQLGAGSGSVYVTITESGKAESSRVEKAYDSEEATAVAIINAATAGTMGTVITNNAGVLGLNLTDYDKLSDKSPVHTALVGKNFANAAAVKAAFDNAVAAQKQAEEEAAAVAAVNSASSDTMGTVITNNAGVLGLDLTDYSNLKDNSPVHTALEGKSFADEAAVKAAFDNAVAVQKLAETPSTAPNAGDIEVTNNYGSDDTVVVSKVPDGAVVKVYDAADKGTKIGEAVNTTGSAGNVTVAISQLGTASGSVYVTITESGKAVSSRVEKTYDSEETTAVDLINTATEDTIKTVLTNNASVLGLNLTDYNKLSDKSLVHTALVGKNFANAAEVKAAFESAVAAQKLTEEEAAAVAAVNSATVDAMGTVITNNASVLGLDLTDYNGLTDKSPVHTALEGKNFADKAVVKAAFDNAVAVQKLAETPSTAPNVGDITITNNYESDDTVVVSNVPDGAVVKVYDAADKGTKIGEAVNTTGSAGNVTVTMTQLGTGSGSVYVTITESGKAASSRVEKTYDSEETTAVDLINTATEDTIKTVLTNNASVLGLNLSDYNKLKDKKPVHAALVNKSFGNAETVKVDFDNAVAVQKQVEAEKTAVAAVNSAAAGTMEAVITENVSVLGLDLTDYKKLKDKSPVHTALEGKSFIDKTAVKTAFDNAVAVQKLAETPSTAPNAGDITVTNNYESNDTVVVSNVPAGAVVKVYDAAENGTKLGEAVNTTGSAGNVTVTIAQLGTGSGSVYVTITESRQAESIRVEKVYDSEEATVVGAVNAATEDTIKTVITNNAGVLGLNLTDYNKLSDNSPVHTALVNKSFGNAETVKAAFDNAVAAQKQVEAEAAAVAAVNSASTDTMEAVITENVSVLGLDLTDYKKLKDKSPVHTALEGKSFIDKTAVKTAFDNAVAVQKLAETPSTAPNAGDIIVTNNYESDDTVIVSNVPDGAVVKVYNAVSEGTKIGEVTNSTGSTENVTVTISQLGTASGSVYVTITESKQAESIRVEKAYDEEESNNITITDNPSDDTVVKVEGTAVVVVRAGNVDCAAVIVGLTKGESHQTVEVVDGNTDSAAAYTASHDVIPGTDYVRVTAQDGTKAYYSIKGTKEKPTGVGKTDETAPNSNDGKITGVDNTMEYKLSTESAYQSIIGTEVTGLADAAYHVRVKGDANYEASEPVQVTINSSRVIFKDSKLENIIREEISKPEGEIYSKDVEEIKKLNLFAKGITDISGLSELINLTYLDLNGNRIIDISELAGLTNLTTLALAGNQIKDISSISGLTNLTLLEVYNNQITDISGLSGLSNLTWLKLSGNQITDISGLSKLTNLTTLHLSNNKITDYSYVLSYYKNLTNKDFTLSSDTTITDNESDGVVVKVEGTTVGVKAGKVDYAAVIVGLTKGESHQTVEVVNGNTDSAEVYTETHDVVPGTDYVRVTAQDGTKAWYSIKGTKETPTGISKTDETAPNSSDGKITGVDNTMEYKLSTESEYQSIIGTEITGLADGTYDVRVKGDANYEASEPVQVTINIPKSSAPNEGEITVTNNYGADDTVVVSNVPDGAEVKVYDSEVDGNELGSAVNTTGSVGNVTVAIAQLGTASGSVYVTITESGKAESSRIEKAYDSEETTAVVAINTATAGTMGTVITNNAGVLGLDLTDYNGLKDNSPVYAALVGKNFADKAAVKTAFDNAVAVQKLAETPSTAPNAGDIIVTNNYESDDTVVVSNVLAGATVKVYDSAEDGNELGSAVNSTGSTGNVTVTIAQLGIASGSVYVTITESGKAESSRVEKAYEEEEVIVPTSYTVVVTGVARWTGEYCLNGEWNGKPQYIFKNSGGETLYIRWNQEENRWEIYWTPTNHQIAYGNSNKSIPPESSECYWYCGAGGVTFTLTKNK